MTNSREKGKRYERHVAGLFKAEGYDAFLRMRARLGADAEKIFAQTADLLKNAENYTRLPGKSSF
jgi:hypothetical protein